MQCFRSKYGQLTVEQARELNEAEDSWFDFVEDYYSKTSVPLSWALIGGGEITSVRNAGSPSAMTTLSKREWNKVVEPNAPGRNLLGGVATTKGSAR